MVDRGEEFWTTVYEAFMNRDLNRVAGEGGHHAAASTAAGGNYRKVLELFRLPATDYQRFMDFLRHHDLKP